LLVARRNFCGDMEDVSSWMF